LTIAVEFSGLSIFRLEFAFPLIRCGAEREKEEENSTKGNYRAILIMFEGRAFFPHQSKILGSMGLKRFDVKDTK